MDNALIIDLVLAAVLIAFAVIGAYKGLIRSLMALVSVVLALAGAALLTAMFVEPVTELVYPRVQEKVITRFAQDIPADALAQEGGDLNAGGLLPADLADALGGALDTLERFGVSEKTLDGVAEGVAQGVASAAEQAAYLLVKTVVQAALFLVFFLLVMLLLKLLTRALDGLCSLPVLRQLNALGGVGLAGVTFVSQFHVDALSAGVELSDLRNLLLHVCAEIRVNLSITCDDGDVHVFPPWCAAGIVARG